MTHVSETTRHGHTMSGRFRIPGKRFHRAFNTAGLILALVAGIAVFATLVAFSVGQQQPRTTNAAELDEMSALPDSQATTQASTPAEIDWSTVQPAAREVSMGALFRVARHVDQWHGPTRKEVLLTYLPDGTVADGYGNAFDLPPEHWRGLLEMIATSNRQPYEFRAPRFAEGVFDDDFGPMPRQLRELTVTDGHKLRLTWLREYEP